MRGADLMRSLLRVALLLGLASPLAAQVRPDTAAVDTIAADTVPSEPAGPSPAGAMVRSLLVPGWGQLYAGAPRRAAVFIGLQGTSYAMLAHSIRRLDQMKQEEPIRVATARDSILRLAEEDTALARQIEDPERFAELIAADPAVESARDLLRARRRHRQDWIAYTFAFTMASAIDAFVAAHLATFPAGISAEPRADGGVSLQLSVPVGRRP
jgi:hypothetical protein